MALIGKSVFVVQPKANFTSWVKNLPHGLAEVLGAAACFIVDNNCSSTDDEKVQADGIKLLHLTNILAILHNEGIELPNLELASPLTSFDLYWTFEYFDDPISGDSVTGIEHRNCLAKLQAPSHMVKWKQKILGT